MPTRWCAFFGVETATRARRASAQADLLLGNNVLAHVPDLNDFVGGMKVLLKPRRRDHDGVPAPDAADRRQPVRHDLPRALLVLLVLDRRGACSRRHGLRLFDVEELPTHGGSLRIYGCHADDARQAETERAVELLAREERRGLRRRSRPTSRSAERVIEDKRADRLEFLIELKRAGKRIVGYGAPAKGNTLLNYCGIGTRLPRLHGRPATRTSRATCCPARTSRSARPRRCARTQPDVVLILPWNLKDEIMEQLAFIREWGGAFAVRTPELTLLP